MQQIAGSYFMWLHITHNYIFVYNNFLFVANWGFEDLSHRARFTLAHAKRVRCRPVVPTPGAF